MPKLIKWLDGWGVITTVFVIWCLSLTSWVTYQIFNDITAITTQAAAAYATLFALPSMGVGMWQWRVNKLHSGGDK